MYRVTDNAVLLRGYGSEAVLWQKRKTRHEYV
jgi:hypothetical protein